MTGPAVGKVRIDVEVLLEDRPIKCDVYIHIKGYSRALVTHLDVEGFDVSAGKKRIPAIVVGRRGGITVILSEPIVVEGREIRKIRIRGLKLLGVGKKGGAYLGIKEGGFFIGVKRELIRKLEELAREKAPELFKDKNASLDRFLS